MSWYIDGSLLDGPFNYSSRAGFVIVVTSRAGALLGRGYGIPPEWVVDAHGAET